MHNVQDCDSYMYLEPLRRHRSFSVSTFMLLPYRSSKTCVCRSVDLHSRLLRTAFPSTTDIREPTLSLWIKS
jgi:hypothetical protein